MAKKVTVAQGIKISQGKLKNMRKKKGSSNTGKYKTVKPSKFAGAAGGASPYSFPIPDVAHARNALARAHFAPHPDGIRKKVFKMYPQLKKRTKKKRS